MITVAYLANQFPADVEPYVSAEIDELRRRGANVIAGSARAVGITQLKSKKESSAREILSLRPLRIGILLRALVLVLRRWQCISGLLVRVLFRGNELLRQRFKALSHTALGAYYAALLEQKKVNHIHVHHGYFAAWVAMVTARLLGIGYSLTLHGSDLLLGAAYLDTKLQNCSFCITISDYNRNYLLEQFPHIDSRKILVCRLGVNVPDSTCPRPTPKPGNPLTMVAVGRLHPVKDHAFLLRACSCLRDQKIDFRCLIAGEGPERARLESVIRENQLQQKIRLLGHVNPLELDALYQQADVVVLTSRSEGIPLVLMEAMALGKIVLAPAITGIPEIVIPGKTGFLFAPGDIDNFVAKIVFLHRVMQLQTDSVISQLDWVRHAARVQVLHNFSRKENVARFADGFLQRIASHRGLQTCSIQPPLKRMPPARAMPDDDFCAQPLERPA